MFDLAELRAKAAAKAATSASRPIADQVQEQQHAIAALVHPVSQANASKAAATARPAERTVAVDAAASPAPKACAPPATASASDADKYRKMLKVGAPLSAVLREMGKDGFAIDGFVFDCSVDAALIESVYRPAFEAATARPKPTAAGAAARVGGGQGGAQSQRRRFHFVRIPRSVAVLPLGTAASGNEGHDQDPDKSQDRPLLWLRDCEGRLAISPRVCEMSDRMMIRIVSARAGTSRPRPQSDPAIDTPSTPAVSALIERGRAQNLAILLHGFKFTPTEWRQWLHDLSYVPRHVETLAMLLKLWPTDDEQRAIRAFRGNVTRLGQADRFFVELRDIPRLPLKLECLQLTLRFTRRYENLLQEIRSVALAFRWFMRNQSFANTMHNVFQVCCYVNSGNVDDAETPPGIGFRADTFSKILHLKSPDSRVTMIQIIACTLQENDPDASEVARAMLKMSRTLVDLPMRCMQSEVEAYDAGLPIIVRECELAGNDRDEFGFADGRHYKDRLLEFARHMEIEQRQLRYELDELEDTARRFVAFFHEPTNASVVELIDQLAAFVKAYERELSYYAKSTAACSTAIKQSPATPSTDSTASTDSTHSGSAASTSDQGT